MLADPVDGANDQRDHHRLDAEEDRAEGGLRNIEPEIEPGQGEHQHEARQHEAEPGEKAAEAFPGEHSHMDAELMRLGPGQHLVDS